MTISRTLATGLLFATVAGCSKETTVVLMDDNNYYFLADVSADAQEVAAQTVANVDWSGLTTDLLRRDMDPSTDLNIIRLIRFTLTEAQVIKGINIDNLRQSDVSGNADYEIVGDETSAPLDEFLFLGSEFPVKEELLDIEDAYLLSAISITDTGGEDYRMFSFIDPVDGGAVNDITVTSDSANLEYEVDIANTTPIVMTGTVVTWAALTQDGSDQTIALSNIDSIMVAKFSDSVSAIEADFLRIEENADQLFTANVEGLGEYDLTGLTDASGAAFTAVDDNTWILALRCGSCISPAPLFLGTLTAQ
jgi:hypothetical protein